MAFDHTGDLPEYYDFDTLVDRLRVPTDRATLHERAERRIFLNRIGHPAVISAVKRMAGPVEASLADMGATLYETATDPPFVGNDFVGTPTYCDPDGQIVALFAAYTLDCYDPFEMLEVTGVALDVLHVDAPRLSNLISDVSRAALKDVSTPDIGKIQAGAALMRTVHMTAQYKIYGGDFNGG